MMMYVFSLQVAGNKYPVACYDSEDVAKSDLLNLQKHLKSYALDCDSMLILEQWRINSVLDGSNCETVGSYLV